MAVADHPTNTIPADMRVSLNRVRALYQINDQLMQAVTEQQVFERAVHELVQQAEYGNAWILTLDPASGVVQGRAGTGVAMSPYVVTLAFPPDAQHTSVEVAHTGEPHIVHDLIARADQEGWGDIAREANLQSAVYVPFGTAERVHGVIVVSLLRSMETAEELTLLTLFSSQLTTALMKLKYDHERAQQIAALEEAARTHELLLQTVRDLSTPAIPIYDGILAIPLVGNIDSGRASQVMETVLTNIQRVHAAVVLLDVTGVPVIDTGVANHLVQVTQAAQLLGAKCLLVGIKPEVAQTLVQLGVDLSSIATRSDLQAGMAFALSQRGLRIVESRN